MDVHLIGRTNVPARVIHQSFALAAKGDVDLVRAYLLPVRVASVHPVFPLMQDSLLRTARLLQ